MTFPPFLHKKRVGLCKAVSGRDRKGEVYKFLSSKTSVREVVSPPPLPATVVGRRCWIFSFRCVLVGAKYRSSIVCQYGLQDACATRHGRGHTPPPLRAT